MSSLPKPTSKILQAIKSAKRPSIPLKLSATLANISKLNKPKTPETQTHSNELSKETEETETKKRVTYSEARNSVQERKSSEPENQSFLDGLQERHSVVSGSPSPSSNSTRSNSIKSQSRQKASIVFHTEADDASLVQRGYTIMEKIGEGSFSKIYKAEYIDIRIDTRPQVLAVKIIQESSVSKQFFEKFFKRSVEIMSLVTHENIIRVHSLLSRKQTHFIFMEYAHNGDLLELLRKSGAIREENARFWFKQILDGIRFLHESHIAHRDIKCENILFTQTYNIKITDLDFARYTENDDYENPNTTLSTTFCGSPSYAAPEVICGQPYNPKLADMWSLGVVLYIMLNHSMPFDDQNLKLMHKSQMAKNWSIRSSLKNVLSNEVQLFIGKLLEPNPDRRLKIYHAEADPWIAKQQHHSNNVAIVKHAKTLVVSNPKVTASPRPTPPRNTPKGKTSNTKTVQNQTTTGSGTSLSFFSSSKSKITAILKSTSSMKQFLNPLKNDTVAKSESNSISLQPIPSSSTTAPQVQTRSAGILIPIPEHDKNVPPAKIRDTETENALDVKKRSMNSRVHILDPEISEITQSSSVTTGTGSFDHDADNREKKPEKLKPS